MLVPLAILSLQAVQTEVTVPFDLYTLSNVINVVILLSRLNSFDAMCHFSR